MGKLSKRRGYDWEVEVKDTTGGKRHNAGPGIDVEVLDVPELGPVECKEKQDDKGLKILTGWIEQARKYDKKNQRWSLSVKLGLGVNAYKLMIMDLRQFAGLLNELRELREWKREHAVHLPGGTDRGPEPEGGE